MTSTATNSTVRRRRSFSPKDRLTLTAFVGIPTAFHILLVWVPAIGTIGLQVQQLGSRNLDECHDQGTE